MQPAFVFSEAIKTGLSVELLKAFPNVKVFREQQSNPTLADFPQFFVHQLTQNIEEERKGFYWLHYLMTVIYRLSSEPQTVFNLQSKLDNMSFEMLKMDYIPLSTKFVPLKNRRTEKIEGILHYFCTLDVQVTEPIEEILMWHLDINRKLKLSYELKNKKEE